MKSFPAILYLTFLFFLVGCQSSLTHVDSGSVPTPESGKSIIHGRILSEDKSPQEETVVRLAKVYYADDEKENGTFVLDEASSPSTISDDNGKFLFMDIEPGDYVIFVGQFHNDYMIVSDASQDPNVYSVKEGDVLEIEPIIVHFD